MASQSPGVVCIIPVDAASRGLLYHLGTAGGTRPWRNPMLMGEVLVTASSVRQGQLYQVVDADFTNQIFFTWPQQDSYVQISFKNYIIRPVAYVMAHRFRMNKFYMRNWVFEGSVDGYRWDTLRTHINDETLNPWVERGGWAVEGAAWYAYFRVRMLPGGNDQGTQALVISCFEVFGDMQLRTPAPAP
eukprot:EG_transcript_33507